MSSSSFGWASILRLGLVQASLGAVVVLTTSTLNRVMVVEMALPALLPGLLLALHYVVQVSRPRMGHGSDLGRRRTPWIMGGMVTLAAGGWLAALATVWMGSSTAGGIALAVLAYTLIGLGVAASGTSLLALLAKRAPADRRAAAATTVWIMMIAGFVVTAGVAGSLLDPFSAERLLWVAGGVAVSAVLLTALALIGLEGAAQPSPQPAVALSFKQALQDAWAEPRARRFTIFVFVSMLAFSMQDLILEPFAGLVFGLTPGATTKLSGTQHGGALVGMLLAAAAGSRWAGRQWGSLRSWTVWGCAASALALGGLVCASLVGPTWPLQANVFALGLATGAFSIAAIGSMMGLAGAGDAPEGGHEGVRMGLWGAAQAMAFALGGVLGTAASDLTRWLLADAGMAYALVFLLDAALFLWAARLAARVEPEPGPRASTWESGMNLSQPVDFDAVVVGGGPAGATAADDLALQGLRVLLLDRAGRIKPCGGAIPPRLIADFAIPEHMLVARATAARMISPRAVEVDIPIEGGFVGMVDREHFDEWLRERAASHGAVRRTGSFERVARDPDGISVLHYSADGGSQSVRARAVIGADGARSQVAQQCVPGADQGRFVFAYHEIVAVPDVAPAGYLGSRCEVHYRGELSPDFYGWVFPHGASVSIGTGSADKGFSLRRGVMQLRAAAGLAHARTLRREGAPIPMKPLPRWDNGRDVVLAGDAAGVVAPASGEGIYYAMLGGRLAAEAVQQLLQTGDVKSLALARKRFMREHGRVFWILGLMQRFWYSSDKRRERFVSICRDRDVQQLTFDAYMHKRLVRARPMAHARIFFKDVAHLLGLARV